MDDVEEEEAGETTLYFDAEEGVLRDEDGDTVTFEMGSEDSVDESQDDGEEAEMEDEEEEGTRTPQPGASSAAAAETGGQQGERATQTIRSTSSPTTTQPGNETGGAASQPRRPSRLRRLSSATQTRVSSPFHPEHQD